MRDLRNSDVADRLDEIAALLDASGESTFRVRAYHRAADAIRHEPRSLKSIQDEGGTRALEQLPGIGPAMAALIEELLATGRLALLDRLRGDVSPVELIATIPGIGPERARRAHEMLGIRTLEDLETAAHDGRLLHVHGFGPRMVQAVKDSLAQRLGRLRPVAELPGPRPPPVDELLGVDREYRDQVGAGTLRRIAPRRFNPSGEAWLPILSTERGSRKYTALYSNTALAHQLERTHDWVVLAWHEGDDEGQCTVVTATRGGLAGLRAVRGREAECIEHYHRTGELARKTA